MMKWTLWIIPICDHRRFCHFQNSMRIKFHGLMFVDWLNTRFHIASGYISRGCKLPLFVSFICNKCWCNCMWCNCTCKALRSANYRPNSGWFGCQNGNAKWSLIKSAPTKKKKQKEHKPTVHNYSSEHTLGKIFLKLSMWLMIIE